MNPLKTNHHDQRAKHVRRIYHVEIPMTVIDEPLPQLRFEIPEAARILRISRATLYGRIRDGLIGTQKDGRRTFITAIALQRYVSPNH